MLISCLGVIVSMSYETIYLISICLVTPVLLPSHPFRQAGARPVLFAFQYFFSKSLTIEENK
jgi:hypothetical protein